ncbi:hypothetical protein GBA63_09040 [Rubrobacter tropicus]|uniref:Uncharacterized protein n=1 Tax=Rubrobacter tropicus TaxID=2653851 RepID=A0A6G8Q8Y6_9ACTN|nr:hypothetical protein [Rubrobacter tropicus]QIN82777.1 hypothetical protein GBA63_09040 [Rubrobacter tropicus]
MNHEDRRRIAQEEVYRERVRAEYRVARTREGLASAGRGLLGLFNLGVLLFAAGVWIVWSVILFVVLVLTLVDGSGAAAIYGLLFLLVFFGPLFWLYVKYLGIKREREKREEKQRREREARESRWKQQDEAMVEEEPWEGFARAENDKYATMAREWERRWGVLTKDLPEEEAQKLHKEFLTDNPGRTDEERWEHIDGLFNERSVT